MTKLTGSSDPSGRDLECRVYTIPEAGQMAGLSRNKSYDAAKRGEIPTIKFGKLRKVPAAAWHRILSG
jgi:excisionase family DNA binding protein